MELTKEQEQLVKDIADERIKPILQENMDLQIKVGALLGELKYERVCNACKHRDKGEFVCSLNECNWEWRGLEQYNEFAYEQRQMEEFERKAEILDKEFYEVCDAIRRKGNN